MRIGQERDQGSGCTDFGGLVVNYTSLMVHFYNSDAISYDTFENEKQELIRVRLWRTWFERLIGGI